MCVNCINEFSNTDCRWNCTRRSVSNRRFLAAVIGFSLLCSVSATQAQDAPHPKASSPVIGADTINLPKSLYKNVQIQSIHPGILPDEATAYYTILNHAENVSQSNLRKGARSFQKERGQQDKRYRKLKQLKGDKFVFPAFVDLFQHPDDYVGKPVMLKGHARKYRSYPAGKNDYDIKLLHELWLYTDDSQQNPCVLVFTDLPEGLPTNEAVIEGVSVTGYFFKMYVYSAQDTVRYAPMLLAKTVSYNPPEKPDLTSPIPPIAYVLAVLVILGIVISLWWVSRGDRKSRDALLKHTQTSEDVDLTSLEQSTPVDESTDIEEKPGES